MADAPDSKLTTAERIMFEGIASREREVNSLLGPIRRDFEEFAALVGQRLGLPEGAIGNTHVIDLKTLSVIPLAEQAKSDPAAPAVHQGNRKDRRSKRRG